jgi:hypothetical protein
MKRSKELVECFGDDAVHALNNNGTWEYQPETIECGNWNPYWCDDCETWHQNWYMTGYRIEDGIMYEVIHSCDSDGNWEIEDEYDVDDEDYERWNNQYAYEQTEQAATAYREWVAENGEDPLGEFYLDSNEKVKYLVVVRYQNGFHFHAAKPVDDEDWQHDETKLPERLQDFLQLSGKKLDIDDLGWKSAQDFADNAHVHEVEYVNGQEVGFVQEIEVPRPSEILKKELIEKAKKSLTKSW